MCSMRQQLLVLRVLPVLVIGFLVTRVKGATGVSVRVSFIP